MFYSSFGSISYRLWDIQCRKISRPWNPCQGSIKVIENGTIRYTGYGFLLVFHSNFVPKTRRYWDIRLQTFRDLENWVRGQSRSLKMSLFDWVHMTFYLTFHSTHGPISYRFWDRRRFQSKITKFSHPVYFAPPLKGFPLELATYAWGQKTRMMGLFQFYDIFRPVDTMHRRDRRTDWRTDGRTPGDSKDRAYA